ncbi:hypothetical protein [Modestobacter sp. URMC 112]
MPWRTALTLVCCSVLTGCVVGDRDLAPQIVGAIEEAGANGDVLDLAAVVDGDWDQLTFVCPYEDEQVVTERLGFDWADFPGPDTSEVAVLYVFSTADEVVTWTRLQRGDGDPCGGEDELPVTLPREDAVLTVERTEAADGHDSYELHLA